MTFFDFFFKVQNILSLIVAMLLFCMYCEKRKYFLLRLIPSCLIVITVSTLLWDAVKNSPLVGNGKYWGIVGCNVLYIAELFGICMLCFKCKITEAITYIVGGWVTQHLSGMISSVTARLLGIEVNYFHYDWKYFLITLLSYIEVYTAVWLLFRHIRKNSTFKTSKRVLIPSVVMFVVIIVLNIYMPYDASLTGFLVMRCYSMACCIVMLFLIFGAFKEGKLNYSLEVLEQLERQKSEQYAMSKESIDVINNKCHDLKKLLKIITDSKSKMSDGEIAEISGELERYDAIVKTGNEAFDTIVTEKSLFCSKNKIALSVIADGDSLRFMSDLDIYSLFGNILDNAIEATRDLDEPHRIVNLTVRAVNGFLSVHSENCFEGALEFAEGMPVTTKDDKTEHGYGVFSIKSTVKKYGGEAAFSAEDGMFALDALIPINT